MFDASTSSQRVSELVDALAQGQPIPWGDLDDATAEAVDDRLAEQAGSYVEQGDVVRMSIFLRERQKYSERRHG